MPPPSSSPSPARRTEFLATGFHVPARVVTNDDLAAIMDTSDEWIVQRRHQDALLGGARRSGGSDPYGSGCPHGSRYTIAPSFSARMPASI
jgi:hypothetical protein